MATNVDQLLEILIARVAELTEKVDKLTASRTALEVAFQAGIVAGQEQLLGKAASTSSRTRPRHLHAVDDGTS